jgi:hypothetical protein
MIRSRPLFISPTIPSKFLFLSYPVAADKVIVSAAGFNIHITQYIYVNMLFLSKAIPPESFAV